MSAKTSMAGRRRWLGTSLPPAGLAAARKRLWRGGPAPPPRTSRAPAGRPCALRGRAGLRPMSLGPPGQVLLLQVVEQFLPPPAADRVIRQLWFRPGPHLRESPAIAVLPRA